MIAAFALALFVAGAEHLDHPFMLDRRRQAHLAEKTLAGELASPRQMARMDDDTVYSDDPAEMARRCCWCTAIRT